MSKHMRHRRIFFSLLIAAIFISLNAQRVYACTPEPETPWFIPSVSLINTNLPKTAAEIKPADNTLLLKNISDVLIQIALNGSYQDMKGYYELSSGQSATLGIDYYDDISIDDYQITHLDSLNVFADNRPPDVKAPDPQIAWVLLLTSNQSYFIQLQISYMLNPDYRPDSVSSFSNACEGKLYDFFANFNSPITGFACVLSLVVVLGIFVFVRLRQRKSNVDSNPDEN